MQEKLEKEEFRNSDSYVQVFKNVFLRNSLLLFGEIK